MQNVSVVSHHAGSLIRDLCLILGAAALSGLVTRIARLPAALGYLCAGVLLGQNTPWFSWLYQNFGFALDVKDQSAVESWAQLGVVFLMFSLGIEFSFRKLMRLGFGVIITALFEVGLMVVGLGVIFKSWTGSTIQSLALGAVFSISSTMIIVKTFESSRLTTKSFAQKVFGILIVEDLLAITMLVVVPSILVVQSHGHSVWMTSVGLIFRQLVQLILVISTWFIVGYYFLPRFIDRFFKEEHDELLVGVALALCFLLALLSVNFGFSEALGSFILGSILAESSQSKRIERLVEPLKNVFSSVFFVSIGMLVDVVALKQDYKYILTLSLLIFGFKFLLIGVGSLLVAESRKTAFNSALSMGQNGEFSIILALSVNPYLKLPFNLISVVTGVVFCTSMMTPLLVKNRDKIHTLLTPSGQLQIVLATWNDRYRDFVVRLLGFFNARSLLLDHSLSHKHRRRIYIRSFICTVMLIVLYSSMAQVAHKFDFFAGHQLVLWGATSLLSAPFWWGLISNDKYFGPVVRWFYRFALIAFLLFISQNFFEWSLRFWVSVSSGVIIVPMILFLAFMMAANRWPQLQKLCGERFSKRFDHWENEFASVFERSEADEQKRTVKDVLAPWDALLIAHEVKPASRLCGKKLSELDLRSQFQITIVVINRAGHAMVAPDPDTIIWPDDELLLLCQDEAYERFLVWQKGHHEERVWQEVTENYVLRRVAITPASPWAGRSIRAVKIRDEHKALVVGVERLVGAHHERILNPHSDFILEADDQVYLVGRRDRLEAIL